MFKFFKKKEEPIIDSKFKKGEFVSFEYRQYDFKIGYIDKVKKDENGNIIYDILVGGECPVIFPNISEKIVHKYK